MPSSLHILVTLYFGYLGQPKSSSMFVYLLILQGKTGKNGNLKNKQNWPKYEKKSYENDMSQTIRL